MIRLIRSAKGKLNNKAPRYDVWLDWIACDLGNKPLVCSRTPRLDAARKLLEMGHDPDTPITLRVEGREYDSWKPESIGHLSQIALSESPDAGIRRYRYKKRDVEKIGAKTTP